MRMARLWRAIWLLALVLAGFGGGTQVAHAQVTIALPQLAAPAPAPAAASPPAALPSPEAPPVIAFAPDSLGAALLVTLSTQLNAVADDIVHIVRAVTDFPLLWGWVRRLATDRQQQIAILQASWRLALVMGLGIGAEFLVRRALRGVVISLRRHVPAAPGEDLPEDAQVQADAEQGQTEWAGRRASLVLAVRRLPYVVASFLLDLLPVLAVIATGAVLLSAGMTSTLISRLVILTVLNGYVGWRLIVALARTIAAPNAPRLRLLPIDRAQAHVMVHEVSMLAAIAIGGYAIAEDALLFGLYKLAHDALVKLIVLVLYARVVRIVLRNRRLVKNMIRAPEDQFGALAVLRNVLAGSWHRIVILYLLALWLVWALDVTDGYQRMRQMMIGSVVVITAIRFADSAIFGAINRAMSTAEGLDDKYPGLGSRLSGYHAAARWTTNALVTVLALLGFGEAAGFNVLSWFGPSSLGVRAASALVTIGVTLLLALIVWEGTNIAIEQHLANLTRSSQLSRSARLRTLLPMLRTTLLFTVCTVAGLVTLSEIGVNIAPLLAGAGVVGLAIGFGSQKLVQDIITGLFLLLENAMQVGDVVTLGGLSGTVEALSIRTIRLRALDGAVHIVPFSAVTTVSNMTRDYSFALVDVTVGVNEQPDRIADLLREISERMRAEQPWRGRVLADLEVFGLDRFSDFGWVMRSRIKTLPGAQWGVSREFNRRIKNRFDELAIESPITSYRALGIPTPQVTTIVRKAE